MKKILSFVAGVLFLLVLTSTARAESFTAYLTSAQEVPTNASTGTGKARVVVDAAGANISWVVTYTGLTSAQILAHIHAPGAIGANGPVAITFSNPGGTSGTITGSGPITPTQLSQLRSGLAYVNIHTTNNSGGEIRGQLAKNRPVDYDGDGRTDLSVLRFPNIAPPDVAQITYFNQQSTDGFYANAFGDANTDFPAPGDYDGDGKDDLALYRDGANVGDQSLFLILRSSNNTFQAVEWGIAGDQAAARDFDGDGITDCTVFRRGANAGAPAFWFIRQSASGFVQRTVQWGTTGDGVNTGDTPVAGDYDGDGKYDPAVYRFGGLAPNNTFLVLRSSDNTLSATQWGTFSSDYILPGDYDGDNKTDYCAARTGAASTSPMIWYILRSSDGSTRVTQYGFSADLPVQGDYDGDGRTDLAVYRNGATAGASSFFYRLLSLSQAHSGINWGIRGDFPVATFDAR